MRFPLSLCALPLLPLCAASAQTLSAPVVRVQIDSPTKFKAGETVRAHTVEPLFVHNRLAIPSGTVVEGSIAQLSPASHRRRLDAKLHGDFTPLREATIRFDRIVLKDSNSIPIHAALAEESSSVVVFHSRDSKKGSLIHRTWSMVRGKKDQAISTFTAPGKAYRLKHLLYSQLPWHPESLQPGSEYDVTLLQPPAFSAHADRPSPKTPKNKVEQSTILHARLQTDLTSAKAKPGDPVVAVVTEPKLDANNQIEIPEGSLLRGNVLQASHAGKWGHNGALRFTFQKIEFPSGFQQSVTGVPNAVTGAAGANLAIDAEGGSKPQSNRGLMVPLGLGLLATSALTEDEASVGHAATSSNGFGLIGRIVAISTGSQIFGGTLGALATGRAFYSHFLAHGKDVVFPHNTEIQVDLGPNAHPVLSPSAR